HRGRAARAAAADRLRSRRRGRRRQLHRREGRPLPVPGRRPPLRVPAALGLIQRFTPLRVTIPRCKLCRLRRATKEGERMATAAEAAPRLTEEQQKELVALLEGADSAELKLTVAESDQPAVAYALGMDPVDAQIRQVFFFDTPDLTLSNSGVVVR